MMSRAVVVGGGIAGLTAAYRLASAPRNEPPIEVTLLEASEQVGGKLSTVEVAGLTIEAGADSFVTRKPWAVELCEELGLSDELVVPAAMGTFVWTGGRLVPFLERSALGIPADVGELVRWPGMSRAARLRAAMDWARAPSGPGRDETLGELIRRRMGDEALRVLVGPLLGGLSASDPDRLSVDATFPELRKWALGRGLIRGAAAAIKAAEEQEAPGALFATVWGGLERLVDALAGAIGGERIERAAPASAIRRGDEGGYVVEARGGRTEADAVVLATPAFESARLLEPVAPQAAARLQEIPYASTAVVTLAYPEGTGSRLPERAGYVVPDGEGASITACTFLSRKWPREGFGDRAILRCFVGRAGDESILERDDSGIVAAVRRDVDAALSLGEHEDARVVRWERAMPQYELGHRERVQGVRDALPPGIFVAGAAYDGLGIPDCVRGGGEAASRVREHLTGAAPSEQETASWQTK